MVLVSQRELVDAIRKFPAGMEKDRLRCVGQNVTKLGFFPNNLAIAIRSLLVSNNALTSVEGVEQFANLDTLSVSNNLIRYMEDLAGLRSLSHLKKLSLQGNPVAKLPFYRDFVITLCPTLEVLDGLRISDGLRAVCMVNMRQVQVHMQTALRNALRNLLLANLLQKTKLKKEIRQVLLQRQR
ncbi:hypothetical protein EON64_19615 [archaeon]|nr:MAG: hypothetical protein EON64_19615 [archaeon]